jgi:cell division septum initiation protein DivIVA
MLQIAEQSKMLSELRQQLAQVTELKRQVAELKKRGSSIENASLLHVSRSDGSPSPN